MGNRWILWPILLLACASGLGAEGGHGFFSNYLVSYPRSVKAAVGAPLTWGSDEWITAGSVVLVAGSLYWADPEIREMVQKGRTGWGDAAMDGLGYLGEMKLAYPAAGLTVAAGCLAGSDKTVDTGLLCLKSMILSSVAAQGLKLVTQRQRPGAGSAGSFWPESGFSLQNDSFPSGHSTLVWSIAPILAEQYSDQVWVAPLVYGLAILSSYSRLHTDEHWSSDVFTGAVIGYISARLTLKSTPRLAVSPTPQLNGISLSLEF